MSQWRSGLQSLPPAYHAWQATNRHDVIFGLWSDCTVMLGFVGLCSSSVLRASVLHGLAEDSARRVPQSSPERDCSGNPPRADQPVGSSPLLSRRPMAGGPRCRKPASPFRRCGWPQRHRAQRATTRACGPINPSARARRHLRRSCSMPAPGGAWDRTSQGGQVRRVSKKSGHAFAHVSGWAKSPPAT